MRLTVYLDDYDMVVLQGHHKMADNQAVLVMESIVAKPNEYKKMKNKENETIQFHTKLCFHINVCVYAFL